MNQQAEFQEVTDTVDVPKHAGVEGFILAIRGVLKTPRLTNISIDSRGKVSYTRYARREEPRKNIELDFETVSPSAIIRNGRVHELDLESFENNAAVCVVSLFNQAATDQLYPVAWVIGANSLLHAWHLRSTGVPLPNDSAYGLPVLRDRFIPDEALLLACAYGPGAALIDAQSAYKITIPAPAPKRVEPAETTP